jgi:hypothetical protein
MEPIIRAILDFNLPEVRRLMANDAKAAWMKSESGRTPAQVAYAAGNFAATAAILRNTPQCIDEIPTSPPELLEDLIRDFSQSTLCSAWNQNIEFDLWALVIEDPEHERDNHCFQLKHGAAACLPVEHRSARPRHPSPPSGHARQVQCGSFEKVLTGRSLSST